MGANPNLELDGSRAVRAVIADDEPLSRKKLRLFCERIQKCEIVTECGEGHETVAAVRTLKPDLLLLDVQMPDMSGFEVLEALDTEPIPLVVFTTAYDEYAIRAFEAGAIDYLLKPFDEERLRKTIGKVQSEIEKEQAQSLARRVAHMFSHASAFPRAPEQENRLVIKSRGRIIFLDYSEIDWIEAAANYVRFHAGADSHILRESIGAISSRLDRQRFVRIHRSIIVNIDKVKELQPCNTGEYMMTLKSGKELPCSRSYCRGLRQFIQEF
jgi:two-component system, LytTR family, response regulator